MSYPNIGMPGILSEGEEWDAAHVEQLLRAGHHIFFEDELGRIGIAKFEGEEFLFVVEAGATKDTRLFGSKSFLEFAVWCAFMGRDFL